MLPDFDLAGTVDQLFIHPVKSCAGIAVQQALLTDTGLQWDRTWMVVDDQGEFLTQRTLPRMALVRPQLVDDALVLHAPGQTPLGVALAATGPAIRVRVWGDGLPAWDMGAAAAQWFSDCLGQPCRLVRFDPAQRRLASRDWTDGAEVPYQFADGFPLLLASTAGLDALNAQLATLGQGGVGMERFRPNLVLGGVDAHAEDWLELLHIDTGASGGVQLQPVKPCVRCPIPDIDPASAQRGTQVGDALRRYRHDARMGGALTFGMNAIVRTGVGQVLRVGQSLGGHYRFV